MGFLLKLTEYSAHVVKDYDSALRKLREESEKKDFSTDRLVQTGLQMWFKSVDRWCNLFGSLDTEPTPIAFFDITKDNQDITISIHVPAVDPRTLTTTDVLPLGSSSGKIQTTDIALEATNTGVLNITLKNIKGSGLSAGLYQGFILATSTPTADPTPFAAIAVRVK